MSSYALLVRWRVRQLGPTLPIVAVLQIVVSMAFIVGIAFYLPTVTAESGRLLGTAALTMNLATIGLVFVPQNVAGARAEGMLDYTRTLPVPRLSFLLADLSVWLVAAIPGALLALIGATVRFDLDLRPQPLVIVAVPLVALMAAAIGYAIAMVSPSVPVTLVITQLVFVALFMFSPIAFSADRLPGALLAVHQVLPIRAMADLIRGTLLRSPDVALPSSFAMVGAWTAGALAVSDAIARRRR